MNKISLLLKAQIYNTFSINEVFGKESKNRKHTVIIGIGILLLIAFICAYNVITALALVNQQQQALVPSYMIATASFTILGFTLLCSNGILFGTKDFEMLSSLPISSKDVISSKFLFMYLLSFALCFLFMIPAGVIWIYSTGDSIIFFITYAIGTFFVPLIPMCIALLVGVMITAISSRFQNKNILSLILSILSLGILLGVVVYSMQTGASGGSIGVVLARQISRLYLPSTLFIYDYNFPILRNCVFYLISLVLFLISLEVSSKKYMKINALMLKNTIESNSKVEHKKHSQIITMYKKEISRFFNSYLYMLNTGLGVFALFGISILLCFIPTSIFTQYTGIEDTATFFGQFGPLIIASMLSISCTTSSSISLEGKNIQILQTIPLSKKSFLNAKILFNLSLHSFAYILSVIVFIVRFDLSLIETATIIIVPAIYSLFISVQGLYFNSKFPKFDWDNEVIVIKQSISVILASLIGLSSIAIPTLLHWSLNIPLQTVLWSITLLLICITAILYQKTLQVKII